ncbi:MAG: hypothetical protein JWR55_232 [Aeromicrobium sp.]|jgi:uncharacterized protein (DUF305 family)|nr:hypothetical protein [Aeromicrobium sp.]
MRRTPLSAAAAMAATLAVAGCSGTGSTSDTYNAEDLQYAKDVISAHQRTLELADLARAKTTDSAVLETVDSTDDEARAEIAMVAGYIGAWGQTPDTPDAAHQGEADDPQVRGKDELAALASLDGPQFDLAFIATTVAHNREYVARAERQLSGGYDKLMLGLARSISAERRQANMGLASAAAP